MNSTTLAIIIIVLAAVLIVALFAVMRKTSAERRHRALQRRFGPEYEHALKDYGSMESAERELLDRERRVKHLNLRDLDPAERERFLANWRSIQAQFVDNPAAAVTAADQLIESVMRARGYAVTDRPDFDQRVADLSVEHGGVVQHYRAARALADANRSGNADTEELRQAVVHYRALFADLLGERAEPSRAPSAHGPGIFSHAHRAHR